MIIFFGDGRAGNQIFQYAFLKTISNNNEYILCANMNDLFNYFNLSDNCLKCFNFKRYQKIILIKIIYFLVKIGLIGYIKQNRSDTSQLPTYKRLRGLINITYVDMNFFQSEKFFNLNNFELKLKDENVIVAESIFKRIPSEFEKVFIHVRRGDYLNEFYLGKRGINLPLKYYFKAINEIERRVNNPYYIILSDDPEFVEIGFANIENKYISDNSPEVDFALMTLCKYGICSNSSFSWWGSYLMGERLVVYMPKYWYGWKSKVESHVDIQPKWAIILDVD